MILNLNGILFAVQVVLLLFVGPYADYGNWRAPFLLGKCPRISNADDKQWQSSRTPVFSVSQD
jgi:hypothetical protein